MKNPDYIKSKDRRDFISKVAHLSAGIPGLFLLKDSGANAQNIPTPTTEDQFSLKDKISYVCGLVEQNHDDYERLVSKDEKTELWVFYKQIEYFRKNIQLRFSRSNNKNDPKNPLFEVEYTTTLRKEGWVIEDWGSNGLYVPKCNLEEEIRLGLSSGFDCPLELNVYFKKNVGPNGGIRDKEPFYVTSSEFKDLPRSDIASGSILIDDKVKVLSGAEIIILNSRYETMLNQIISSKQLLTDGVPKFFQAPQYRGK